MCLRLPPAFMYLSQLQVLRKQEEDQERVRRQKILEMGPPKISIPFRKIYGQNQTRTRMQAKRVDETFDGEEEFCILHLSYRI